MSARRGPGPLGRIPLYPVSLALFAVLSLASHNAGDVPFVEWIVPALLVTGVATVAVAALALALRDAPKAAFVVAVLTVFLLYYGQVTEVLPSVSLALPAVSYDEGFRAWLGTYRVEPPYFVWIDDRAAEFDLFFVPLWLAATAGALLVGLRRRRDWSATLPALNLAGLLLVAMPAAGLVRHAVAAGGGDGAWRPDDVRAVAPVGPARDIYYLVFDRYASGAVLSEFFDFDNGEFLDALRARGFYIAGASHANYPQTMHSLASSMNLEYLDGMSEEMRRAPGLRPVLDRMENHRVGAILRRSGYRYVHGGAWWSHTRRNRNADEAFRASLATDFAGELMDLTVLTHAFSSFVGDSEALRNALATAGFSRLARWKYVKAKLEWLADIPDRPEPTFTFAHFLTPHNPYVFDADGAFIPRWEELERTRRQNYLDQVRFINGEILRLVDTILARSEVAPIIILQADEGPYPERFYAHQGGPTKWREATPDELRMKLGILNAYHLPGLDSLPLHPGITPVNTFRVVFNEYFGTDYELLPDRSYIFSGDFHQFWDVTDAVLGGGPEVARADRSRPAP